MLSHSVNRMEQLLVAIVAGGRPGSEGEPEEDMERPSRDGAPPAPEGAVELPDSIRRLLDTLPSAARNYGLPHQDGFLAIGYDLQFYIFVDIIAALKQESRLSTPERAKWDFLVGDSFVPQGFKDQAKMCKDIITILNDVSLAGEGVLRSGLDDQLALRFLGWLFFASIHAMRSYIADTAQHNIALIQARSGNAGKAVTDILQRASDPRRPLSAEKAEQQLKQLKTIAKVNFLSKPPASSGGGHGSGKKKRGGGGGGGGNGGNIKSGQAQSGNNAKSGGSGPQSPSAGGQA